MKWLTRLILRDNVTKPLLRNAFRAYRSDHFQESARFFEEYLHSIPGDWRARLWYARTLSECLKPEQSLDELKHVSDIKPDHPVAYAFSSLVLYDNQDFQSAEDVWKHRYTKYPCRMGSAMAHLAHLRESDVFTGESIEHIKYGNPDVQGRYLHFAELHSEGLPESVLRDFMDEIGIGWPRYRFPPPWLFQSKKELRHIWRSMAGGLYDSAFYGAQCIAERQELNNGTIPTLVAAAMLTDNWNQAFEWACSLPHIASLVRGESTLSGLRLYQTALACGMMLLMNDKIEESIPFLKTAVTGDSSSYLPFYALGIAGVRLDQWHMARRAFTAVCERVNPGLSLHRWSTLRSYDG